MNIKGLLMNGNKLITNLRGDVSWDGKNEETLSFTCSMCDKKVVGEYPEIDETPGVLFCSEKCFDRWDNEPLHPRFYKSHPGFTGF